MNKIIKRYGARVWHRYNLHLFFVVIAIAFITCLCLVPPLRSQEFLFPSVATALGLFYFLQQDRLQRARFCRELVTEFNTRYDKMNEQLLKLLPRDKFGDDDELAFVDYFNLCAEEYLFYRNGYIYKEIWEAWQNGMKQYAKNANVGAIWAEEKKTDSYYGFEFPVCE
jgi:hypothetical protein